MAEEKPNDIQAQVEDEKEPTVTHVRPPNLATIYVNAANVTLGALEMRLYLAETAPNLNDSGITATDRVCVLMAPEFCKFMAERLLKSMEQYEKAFGKLRDVRKGFANSGDEPTE